MDGDPAVERLRPEKVQREREREREGGEMRRRERRHRGGKGLVLFILAAC